MYIRLIDSTLRENEYLFRLNDQPRKGVVNLYRISTQEIYISMEEDTLLVCRKAGKTGKDSNLANYDHYLLLCYIAII